MKNIEVGTVIRGTETNLTAVVTSIRYVAFTNSVWVEFKLTDGKSSEMELNKMLENIKDNILEII